MISRKASIYGAENIEIGSNVRIDDFCILSGKIQIGSVGIPAVKIKDRKKDLLELERKFLNEQG